MAAVEDSTPSNAHAGEKEGEEENVELDLSSQEVITKYKNAAEIANKALQAVLESIQVGSKIVDLCVTGDETITKLCSSVFKNAKKKIEKGVAFPTSVSVNHLVGHFSPPKEDATALAANDVVKIDLGCHIDGFIAVVAHTVVVPPSEEDAEGESKDKKSKLGGFKVTGKVADVIAAVNTAADVAVRLMKPGKTNKDVTDAFSMIASAFGVKCVEGVLSHQLKQFVIDGNKVIMNVPNTTESRVDEIEFAENETYAVDIVMSTGEGKPKLLDEKQTMIYKRALDKSYSLKMKASRAIFSEICSNFAIMPFNSRSLEIKGVRLGLVECVNHELLQPYPVLHEKQGEFVAQVKFTLLILPTAPQRVTGGILLPADLQQEIEPDTKGAENEEVKALLALSAKTKKKGGGKKKKGKKAGEEEEGKEEKEEEAK